MSPQEWLNNCQVARPAGVITSDPATWVAMALMAQARRPACSKVTTSAEKVEKVVSPPQKPVTMSKRHSGAIWCYVPPYSRLFVASYSGVRQEESPTL
jgi:hypothetical protein